MISRAKIRGKKLDEDYLKEGEQEKNQDYVKH